MNYIVFDLEWNQPSTEEATVTEPLFLSGEIIQLGAVKLDDNFQTVDQLRLYIAPKYYTKMHRRIATLTGIRDADLHNGKPFPEAFREFIDWCGPEFSYMSWSLSDLPILADNMRLHGIADPLPVCYDIQRIFAREIMRASRRISLDDALAILGLRGDTAHDALNDARNTVKIIDQLDLGDYLEEYATEVTVEGTRMESYNSVSEILAEESLKALSCPDCGEEILLEDWLPNGGWQYMSAGVCPQEDEYLVFLTWEKHLHGALRPRRMICRMSDDLWEQYQDQKEALHI